MSAFHDDALARARVGQIDTLSCEVEHLRAVNAELLEALADLVGQVDYNGDAEAYAGQMISARLAIAKAKSGGAA